MITGEMILFGAFCVAAALQLFYYLAFFTGVFRKREESKVDEAGVSVVICARNHKKHLEENLELILNQDYPSFEVIVVNDGSTDGTIDYLDGLKRQYNHLNVLHLDIDERFHRGKKFAQTIGIKAAKNEHMLFTDADCKPVSDQWIRHMNSSFTPTTQIVLGVGNYQRKIGLTNWIVQLETFHTLLLYINFAISRIPYMGVGRNLAYRRPLFFSVKGFASHQHLLSGDDDLFVNETANRTNTSVCIHDEARTISAPPKSLGQWLKQKKRHYSTGKVYRPMHRILLGMYSITLFFFYVLGGLAIWEGSFLIPALGVVGFRFLVQAIVLFQNMRKFDYLKYYAVFPFMDIGILLIHIFVGIRGYFSTPQRWNS